MLSLEKSGHVVPGKVLALYVLAIDFGEPFGGLCERGDYIEKRTFSAS